MDEPIETLQDTSHLNFEKEKLEAGKNPGLGIRSLHETGKGIHVAIIDQPLGPHKEYSHRIVSNIIVDDSKEGSSMHGSAVSSLLCGNTCGIAPEALLHYYAGKGGSLERIEKGLKNIIEKNESVEPSSKIRVVSISKGLDKDSPEYERTKKIIESAIEKGIFVFYVTNEYIPMMGGGSNTDKEDPLTYETGLMYKQSATNLTENKYQNKILIPTDYRTKASYLNNTDYTYEEQGGMSWAIPYLAGIATLALQKNPNLTFEEFNKLVISTATVTDKGFKVINPVRILDSL
jgi:serine protease AprX